MRLRKVRTITAWCLLVGAIVGWPVTQLTIARDEPPFTLGLSWLAIILTAADLVSTSQVHQEQGEQ